MKTVWSFVGPYLRQKDYKPLLFKACILMLVNKVCLFGAPFALKAAVNFLQPGLMNYNYAIGGILAYGGLRIMANITHMFKLQSLYSIIFRSLSDLTRDAYNKV